jgi:hypothetical protein
MTAQTVAPAEVLQDQGRGGRETHEQDESSNRAAQRKLKNVWYEDGGRYLYRYGANGSTVFDVWKLIGEPLTVRGGRQ